MRPFFLGRPNASYCNCNFTRFVLLTAPEVLMLPSNVAITVSRNSKRHPVSSLSSPSSPTLRISYMLSSSIFSRMKFRWHGAKDSDRPKRKQDGDSKEPRSPRPFCQKLQNLESLVPLRLGSEQLQNDIGYLLGNNPSIHDALQRPVTLKGWLANLNPAFSSPIVSTSHCLRNLHYYSFRDDSFDLTLHIVIRGKYSPKALDLPASQRKLTSVSDSLYFILSTSF
jgi:hypothetical protein